MKSSTPKIAVGGQAFRVGDCRVWAEIYYLDSPTDYREYINADGGNNTTKGRELVMLNDLTSSNVAKVCTFVRRCLDTFAH